MAMIERAKNVEARYDGNLDMWYFDVPFAVSSKMMRGVRDFVLRVNVDRARSLPPGDRKDFVTRGIEALKKNRIKQRIAKKGEHVLFQATEGTGKIYSIGGSN